MASIYYKVAAKNEEKEIKRCYICSENTDERIRAKNLVFE